MAIAKKQSSGKWRIQPQKTVNGKQIRTSITAPTKKEAERLAAIWEAVQEEEDDKKETLKDVFDQYLNTCKVHDYSPSTIKEYTSRSKTSFPDLLDKLFYKITTNDIQKQIDKRAESVSPKTLRNDIAFLRAAVATRNNSINFARIKIAKKKKRKKLEMRQEWKITIPIQIAKWYGKGDFYLYILLIIYAGLRPSEAYALTWGDVSKASVTIGDTQIGYISVTKAVVESVEDGYQEKGTKTESGNRDVVVSWALIEEILSFKTRGSDEERIFTERPYNHKYTPRWDRIKKEYNLPSKMRRYDLRHFFATSLVVSGATEEELQQQMGHSTSSFSHAVYVEVMEEHKIETTTKFAKESREAIDKLKKAIPSSAE